MVNQLKFKLQKENVLELFPKVNVVRVDVPNQTGFDMLKDSEARNLPEIVQSILGADFFEKGLLFEYDKVCIFHPLAALGVLFRELTPPS